MIPSTTGSVSEKISQPQEAALDGDAHGPMPQQDSMGCHGHEMHPQKLVRLVGCHDARAGKRQADDRQH